VFGGQLCTSSSSAGSMKVKEKRYLRSDRNYLLFLSVKEVLLSIMTEMRPFNGLTNCHITQNISMLTFIILRNHMLVSKMQW
jgi:hypothetical protein